MAKLYFLGGEDIAKRDSRGINRKAFTDAGGVPAVLIFNWTAESQDKLGRYGKIMAEYFKDLGAREVEFAELSDSLQEIAEKVDASDLIYLPGGNIGLLVDRLRNAKADSLIREYGKIIVGNSAGALALCNNYVAMKKRNRESTAELVSGVGLVDFAVSVHYESRIVGSTRSLDEQLRRLSERVEVKIYAIPEKCALVCTNGSLTFMGDIYLFYKGRKIKCK